MANKKEREWKEITLENSDVWDKKEPIEGVLVKTENEIGPNSSKMYSIETDEGIVKVWGSTVLDDKLANLPDGILLKIEYEGTLKSKKGTEYHSYKVFIEQETDPKDDKPINIEDIPF